MKEWLKMFIYLKRLYIHTWYTYLYIHTTSIVKAGPIAHLQRIEEEEGNNSEHPEKRRSLMPAIWYMYCWQLAREQTPRVRPSKTEIASRG